MSQTTADAGAAPGADSALGAAWDLSHLLGGADGPDALLDRADALTTGLATARGTVATMPVDDLVAFMTGLAELQDLVGRAGSYTGLAYSTDTADPALGAAMQRVEERSTAIATQLLFFELEWAEVDDARVDDLLADDRLAFCRHHLRSVRRYRPHLLTEPEERIVAEKDVTGRSAWVRLFDDLTSAIRVRLDGVEGVADGEVGLEQGLSMLAHPSREVRRAAAEAVTAGLAPGLRTRAYVFNTLLADKSTEDRLRSYPHWLASRNLANEASDESVQALVDAVRSRYGLAQRWYRLKARLLGIERLADYDRMAPLSQVETSFDYDDARDLVLDAYASFSPDLAGVARRFFDEDWIDAPVRPAKRPGAFCAYTTPSVHPYVLLNWTSRRRDVLTLAHELGHGVHAYLARPQGIFHQSTPLTLAETASVFGETVTFGMLLGATTDPAERLSLLAENVEGAIATVFRQTAMNRFEDLVHTHRREQGELAPEVFCDLWAMSQSEMLADSVEITPGYRTWWSYIPHFIGTPGYVYAYAYGQLLALAVYRRYEEQGSSFVPRYLELLGAGGSMAPQELGGIVGVDLSDPGFWDGGLAIVEERLGEAERMAADLAPGAVG